MEISNFVPAEYSNIQTNIENDKLSGTAFFLSSLGLSLLNVFESSWASGFPEIQSIHQLDSKITKSLDYLISQKDNLLIIDSEAPNRLIYDAIAYYSLGKYLNNNEAMQIGLQFLNAALSRARPQGYFDEKGGWDSSYQGVSVNIGMRLFSILDSDSEELDRIFSVLSCGAEWEASRVFDNGEVSTEGNTRVFPGGEEFLGNEKTVAYSSIVSGFWFMYKYTNNARYEALGWKVLNFYTNQ